MMLGNTKPTPMIAVRDLDRARAFYEQALGLKTVDTVGAEVVRAGDIDHGEGMKTTWFKDPDGNILSLFEG